jgi:predicted nuclease with TOPRIM domain
LKRDREIQGLNAAIANLRSQEKRVSERLEEDRKRAESFRRRKEPLPDPVKEDIVRGEGEQKVLAEQIKRKLDEIDAIDNKYASLKKRYLELRRN